MKCLTLQKIIVSGNFKTKLFILYNIKNSESVGKNT